MGGESPRLDPGNPRLWDIDPKLGSHPRRLDAGFNPQLGVNRREVVADSLRREVEAFGDLRVAQTRRHQRQHFCLTPGQTRRIGAGRRLRTAPSRRNVAHTE